MVALLAPSALAFSAWGSEPKTESSFAAHTENNQSLTPLRVVHPQTHKAFWVDCTLVSVESFSAFATRTSYQTQAERRNSSWIFDPNNEGGRWLAANFRFPYGDIQTPASNNHPVTHVSQSDAKAFCLDRGGRLPTSVEWKAAARGGDPSLRYAFGNHFSSNHPQANVWNGSFPHLNTMADGYLFTSPITAFPRGRSGLYDMAGNVWQWTDDGGLDASLRGGSFLCSASECEGFAIDAEQRVAVDQTFMHVGFRCVYDSEP